jgi:dethiobiotin synthetase
MGPYQPSPRSDQSSSGLQGETLKPVQSESEEGSSESDSDSESESETDEEEEEEDNR